MEDHKDIILEALTDYREWWSDRNWRDKPCEFWECKLREIDKAINRVEEI